MMETTARFTLSSSLIPIMVMVLFTLQLALKGDDSAASVNYLMQIQGVNDDAWQYMDSTETNQPSASASEQWGQTGP